MISNHTFSNLVSAAPGHRGHGPRGRRAAAKALGDAMAAKNDYVSKASYQLYDTSGSTEDWSYWITGGLGYTFEIGDEGFHPAYEEAVVGEYLGEAPADSAGLGGNQAAYWIAAEAAADPALHSRLTGTAPAKHTISVSKTVTSPTSPVIRRTARSERRCCSPTRCAPSTSRPVAGSPSTSTSRPARW